MGQTLMLIGAILAALFFIWEMVHEESNKDITDRIVAGLMFCAFIAGLRGDTISMAVFGSTCSIILCLKEYHKK